MLQACFSIAILTRETYETVRSSPTIYTGKLFSLIVLSKKAYDVKSFSSNGSSIEITGYLWQSSI